MTCLSYKHTVWKKYQQNVSSCQQQKKEIDNIWGTQFEFVLSLKYLSLSINVVHYIGRFDLGLNETCRTKRKP